VGGRVGCPPRTAGGWRWRPGTTLCTFEHVPWIRGQTTTRGRQGHVRLVVAARSGVHRAPVLVLRLSGPGAARSACRAHRVR
jgi:hypothetical protein